MIKVGDKIMHDGIFKEVKQIGNGLAILKAESGAVCAAALSDIDIVVPEREEQPAKPAKKTATRKKK